MATRKRGKLKFSLHMNEFRWAFDFLNFLFVFFFFVSKAAPTKAKANKSKPLIISLSSFCQDKAAEKISCQKTKYFPSFVCLLHGEHEWAAFLKSSYNGANNPRPYLIFSKTLNEYVCVNVCINLLRCI